MCNLHSHGHAHGVRTDTEKVLADLRDDLVEELKLINKYEAQIPVIAAEDFTDVDEVVKNLVQIRDNHKSVAASLVKLIHKLDSAQASLFDHQPDHVHHTDHDHD
jgi:uncharacterized coiled-coil protein SlyX